MALQAGRVGVRKDQVDYQGKIIGGGGGADLTPRVEHLEGQIGTFEFSVQDGVAGYKKAGADTFHPFRQVYVNKGIRVTTAGTEFDVGFVPDIVFTFINGNQGAVQLDYWTKGFTRGARGTGTSSGGFTNDLVTVRQTKVTVKAFAQGFDYESSGSILVAIKL